MKKNLYSLLYITTLSSLLVSCGLIEYDIDESVQQAYGMQIECDTAYIMAGETMQLSVNFSPDSISNHEVFWETKDDSILYVHGNDITAIGEGDAYLFATSVESRMVDSCLVHVMPRWEIGNSGYPYEMIVYADVKVGNEFPTENMEVGAFVGTELRGVGKWQQVGSVRFMTFRIYSHYENAQNGVQEWVRFKLYDRSKHTLRTFSSRIEFDGETHGSPSELIKLYLP